MYEQKINENIEAILRTVNENIKNYEENMKEKNKVKDKTISNIKENIKFHNKVDNTTIKADDIISPTDNNNTMQKKRNMWIWIAFNVRLTIC